MRASEDRAPTVRGSDAKSGVTERIPTAGSWVARFRPFLGLRLAPPSLSALSSDKAVTAPRPAPWSLSQSLLLCSLFPSSSPPSPLRIFLAPSLLLFLSPPLSGRLALLHPLPRGPAAPPATPAAPATADAAVPGAGKKRYPTAEEILVLGGYLRLSRSCLVKGSPERHHKQLKISFSETALETTYQYPSESSVLEELGPEPEAPSAPGPPAAPPDDDEDEEELLLLQRELQGGLRTKALIVDESCRR